MSTVSFTTRIDADLKKQLERIAGFDDRSASYVANQAIKAFVDERMATRALVQTGLDLIERKAGAVPSSAVYDWLMDDDDSAFPEASAVT